MTNKKIKNKNTCLWNRGNAPISFRYYNLLFTFIYLHTYILEYILWIVVIFASKNIKVINQNKLSNMMVIIFSILPHINYFMTIKKKQ